MLVTSGPIILHIISFRINFCGTPIAFSNWTWGTSIIPFTIMQKGKFTILRCSATTIAISLTSSLTGHIFRVCSLKDKKLRKIWILHISGVEKEYRLYLPLSFLQNLLHLAHLFKFLFESTFVAHQGPLPTELGTHPLYLLPWYIKGNLHFWDLPLLP